MGRQSRTQHARGGGAHAPCRPCRPARDFNPRQHLTRGIRRASGQCRAKGKRRRVDDDDPPLRRLAIVTKGKATDQELASVKIGGLRYGDGVPREKLGYAAPPPPYDVARDPLLAIAVQPFEGEHAAPWRIPR